ncbi:hypothetical protein [Halosegnis marinus]|uniref:Uncharacterized protein n=1 Tax=Halosegnis marinus TaxID=3034023 RepID=A0ABD5ZLP0_9EURY|nr:hypothetical protein [Halosegnis sp. DT85]
MSQQRQSSDTGARVAAGAAFVFGVFAVVGIGIGLTGYIMIGELGGDGGGGLLSGIVSLVVYLFAALVGPTVACLASVRAAPSLPRSLSVAGATTGAASFVGFLVMVTVALLLVGAASSGGDGGGTVDLAESIGTLVRAGLPSALVAVVATLFVRMLDSPAA